MGAMQTHGLIVAANGRDLYISGTMDRRWNNDALNPAFRSLTMGSRSSASGGVDRNHEGHEGRK
jgi:hypothetical protein